MEDLEPSCIAGENVNGATAWENSLAVHQRVKQRVTKRPSNSTPRYAPKRKNTRVYIKTSTQMFIAALFIIAKSGNSPNVHHSLNG